MLSVLHLYLKRNCWEPYKCTLINVLFTEAYTDLLKYPLLVLGTKPVGSALGAGYTAVCADLPPCDPCTRFVHQAGYTAVWADLPPCDPCTRFVHQAGKTLLSSNSCFMTISPPARVLLLILVKVFSL